MNQSIQLDIMGLLEMAGCRIRGRNRADCSKCKRFRAISFASETFFCHGCGWKGNVITLAKAQGIHQRLSRAEYRQLCEKRERAHDAALRLDYACAVRRLYLCELLRTMSQSEVAAHRAGPDCLEGWASMALVYGDRPGVLAELTIVENAAAADRVKFLLANEQTRQGVVSRVLEHGGFFPDAEKFIEVCA